MQHVPPPPKPSPPRGLAAPEITFQRERLPAIAAELPALFEQHHKELAVGRYPLSPDWDRYFDLDLVGILHVLTVRDGALLAGYVFNLIGPHLHKKTTRWCHVDMYWLHPGYRSGWLGYKMLRANESMAKGAGAAKISIAEKCHFHNAFGRQVSALFRRLGYEPEDVIYGKGL